MSEVVVVTEQSVQVVEVAGSSTLVNVTTTPVEVSISANPGVQGATGATGPAGLLPVFTRTGACAVTDGTSRLYVERVGTIAKVRASLGTPATGSAVIVQLYVNGVAALGSGLSVSAGSFTATVSPSIALAVGDYLTVSILAVGSSTPGADLTVTVTID